jgi:hypothetical protein
MAGFVKRFLGRLGTLFVKEENNEKQQQPPVSVNDCVKPSQGFSVKIAVPADSVPQGPVVCQCLSGDGGVQVCFYFICKILIVFNRISAILCSFEMFEILANFMVSCNWFPSAQAETSR